MRRFKIGQWMMWAGLVVAGCGRTVTSTGANAADAAPDTAVAVDDARSWLDQTPGADGVAIADGGSSSSDAADPPPTDAATDASATDPLAPTCATATVLRDGDMLTRQRLDGLVPSLVRPCNGTLRRTVKTRWYRATVAPTSVLEVAVRGGDDFLVDLAAYDSCAGAVCLGRADSGRTTPPLLVVNASSAPREVFVAVTYSQTGPLEVTVSARIRAIAPNGTCAAPTALAADVAVRAQDVGLSGERAVDCSDPADRGRPALFYSVTVPAREALMVRVHRTSATGGTLYADARPRCGVPGCLPTTFWRSFERDVAGAQYNNDTDAPQTVSVAVSADESEDRAVFEVSASFRALPANAHCRAPAPLASGVPVLLEHPEDASEETPGCPSPDARRWRGLHYEIVVPAAQTLTVTAASMTGSSSHPFVRLFTNCGGACLGTADTQVGTARVVHPNTTAGPQRVLVAAGSVEPDHTGSIGLSATLRAVAPNRSCEGAVTLVPGSPTRQIDILEAGDRQTCSGRSQPSLFYAVDAPAGRTVTITARRPEWELYEPFLALVDGCGGACIGASRSLEGGVAQITFTNAGPARRLIVAIGGTGYTNSSNLLELGASID